MEEGVCQGLGSFLPWSGVPGWDAPLSHPWGPVSLTGAACAVTRSPAPWTPTSPVPTEAAFTLLLYCELLQWEERPLREFLHYPSQPEWQRKEGLCRKVIHYFNKGKVRPPGKPSGRPLPHAARLLDGRGSGSAAEGGERGGERVDARVCASDLEAACFSLEKNKTQLTSVARRPVPGRGRQRQPHVAAPHSCECLRCVAGLPGPRSTHRTHSPAVASQLAVRNELSDEWFGILAGGCSTAC